MTTARKRRSRNKNRGQGHSAITRIGRPANPFTRKRSRYSGKYLTLTIMGGAVFFVFKGCADNDSNDGDGTFYSAVSECIDGGNSAIICADDWGNVKAGFYSNLPKQMSRQSCQTQFGDCYLDSIDQSWVPISSGFLLSHVIRKNHDEQCVYSSGGSFYASRPVWRTTSGDYSWRSGSEEHDTATGHSYMTKKVSTVSRGGYGRSSNTRGHWGG